MQVHVVDGTYELFRHYHAVPPAQDSDGHEIAAVRGVLGSMLSLLREGATHVGVATDHVVESFRNDLWPGYKTADGVPPELMAQFPMLEEGLRQLGIVVWPMVELEADDALGAAARFAAQDPRVETVYICTPDKDLAQCVVGSRVVQFDRRARQVRDAAGVEARFGVTPASIPDYLALVGDSSDGYPGIRGWGAKSAATVLQAYTHLEAIPKDPARWTMPVRNAAQLGARLAEDWELALLFRNLATLRTEAPLFDDIEALRWHGPTPGFAALCARLDAASLAERADEEARRRAKRAAKPG